MKKIILSGLLCTALFADFTLEFKIDGNMKQVVQYRDAQHVKITTDGESKGESGAQLIVGDKKFMVMTIDGHTRYMDMDVMLEQMKQMGGMFGEAPKKVNTSVPEFKVVSKGKKKKIASVNAQEWTVEAKIDGKKERLKIWVTKDDKIVDAIGKYAKTMKTFTQMDPKNVDPFSALFSIKEGTATVDFEGMTLVKYDDADISDEVFALPSGMDAGKKVKSAKTTTAKKPPLCPLTGKHGDAKQLKKMLKPEVDGWKLVENGTCMNMMKMRMENAIYQKGDTYIHIALSVNVEDEKGIVAAYKVNDLNVKGLKRGKIQGHKYQSAYLPKAKMSAMDIRLSNAMLTLSYNAEDAFDIASFAKKAFDLSKFVPVKRSKANGNDAMKSLGNMFGGQGGGSGASEADMKKAGEMLNGLFGK